MTDLEVEPPGRDPVLRLDDREQAIGVLGFRHRHVT